MGAAGLICDVAELVHRHPRLDWERVVEHAATLRIRRLLDLGLCLAGDLLGATIPAPLARHATADHAVRALAAGAAAAWTSRSGPPGSSRR